MDQTIGITTTIALLAVVVVLSVSGTYLVLSGAGPSTTGFATSATGTTTVNVSATVAISLPRNVVSFGNQTVGATNQTENGPLSNTPLPFTLQNDGNIWTNVTVGSGNLFSSAEAAVPSFYYRVNSTASEASTFNGTCTGTGCGNSSGGSFNISWINMPATASASLIAAGMNYANASDLADIFINITVPSVEAAGNKSTTVTFTGSAY